MRKTEYPAGKPKKRRIINSSFPSAIQGFDRPLDRIFSLFDKQVPIYRFAQTHQGRLFELINEFFYPGEKPFRYQRTACPGQVHGIVVRGIRKPEIQRLCPGSIVGFDNP